MLRKTAAVNDRCTDENTETHLDKAEVMAQSTKLNMNHPPSVRKNQSLHLEKAWTNYINVWRAEERSRSWFRYTHLSVHHSRMTDTHWLIFMADIITSCLVSQQNEDIRNISAAKDETEGKTHFKMKQG